MPGPYSTTPKLEKAILIGAITYDQPERQVEEYLRELRFLVETAGGLPVRSFVQKLDAPHPRTFLGSGKLKEIADFIAENEIDLAVFDDELSATQLRNIEPVFKCKVLDRTNLILDIFAGRARTAHAKVQVELAQLQYVLPRLTRMWTHLERQRGGIGLRGPGETELETDRRIIRGKISLLKTQLAGIDKQMATQRKGRRDMVRLALVGYTNVGKSTLMNLMARADVFAEDKLFATLDTTVRKISWSQMPFLLSDTVGFIRKLPHNLVESFKSTLDEVREADVLLHVVDISHPAFESQYEVVNRTLEEIGAGNKPSLVIFNKIDLFTFQPHEADDLTPLTRENLSLDDLKRTWMARVQGHCVFVSAREARNIDELRERMLEMVRLSYQARGKSYFQPFQAAPDD